MEPITIVECPRDAWQGLANIIPTEEKIKYLRSLVSLGFRHIDAVSFVSPKAVPQMSDSERVLELLNPPAHAEIIGIVVNEKGAERALATRAVKTLGFPYSISPEFLGRNQNQTEKQALNILGSVIELAEHAGMHVVAYVSMAFGNPYGDPWSIESVARACDQLAHLGVPQISLADTVGLAEPDRIAATVAAVLQSHPGIEIGVHLHARRNQAASRIRAAYDAGCRRFDSALGGLGGCPFAQDALVGNIPTEILTATLSECGAEIPALQPLDDLLHAGSEIATGARYPAEEKP